MLFDAVIQPLRVVIPCLSYEENWNFICNRNVFYMFFMRVPVAPAVQERNEFWQRAAI